MKRIYIIFIIVAYSGTALAQLNHDVGVSAVISPPDTTNVFKYNPIIVEVTNYGLSMVSFDVIFDVYKADSANVVFSDTITINNMSPGLVDTVTSSNTFSIINLYPILRNQYEYDAITYSTLTLDENSQNDTLYSAIQFITESFLIIGDKYGLPIDVNIGEIIEIPVWGGTPANNYADSIDFILNPISSNDSIIAIRYPSIEYDPEDSLPAHSYFPDTLIGDWDDQYVWIPNPDTLTGWTVQAMLGFRDLGGEPNAPLLTLGDTALIGTFAMKTVYNPNLMGNVYYPFQDGFDVAYGELLWGLPDWVTGVIPNSSYGPIRFKAPDELGYVMGMVTDPNGAQADDVIVSLIDGFREDTTDLSGEYFLQWVTPGIYSMEFYHPAYGSAFASDVEITAGDTTVVDFQLGAGCEYLAGNVNGDDLTNGIDVVYFVAYLKGGPPPPDQCDCPPHGVIYSAADANGSCATNGLDVTYMVAYFKGGSPLLYCADCPPQ